MTAVTFRLQDRFDSFKKETLAFRLGAAAARDAGRQKARAQESHSHRRIPWRTARVNCG
jgi:hypothetical protein